MANPDINQAIWRVRLAQECGAGTDRRSKLKGPDSAVLVFLALSCSNEKPDTAWPSINTIQQRTKFSRSTVIRSLKRLCKIGLIQREPRERDGDSRYTFLIWETIIERRELGLYESRKSESSKPEIFKKEPAKPPQAVKPGPEPYPWNPSPLPTPTPIQLVPKLVPKLVNIDVGLLMEMLADYFPGHQSLNPDEPAKLGYVQKCLRELVAEGRCTVAEMQAVMVTKFCDPGTRENVNKGTNMGGYLKTCIPKWLAEPPAAEPVNESIPPYIRARYPQASRNSRGSRW